MRVVSVFVVLSKRGACATYFSKVVPRIGSDGHGKCVRFGNAIGMLAPGKDALQLTYISSSAIRRRVAVVGNSRRVVVGRPRKFVSISNGGRPIRVGCRDRLANTMTSRVLLGNGYGLAACFRSSGCRGMFLGNVLSICGGMANRVRSEYPVAWRGE